MDQTRPAAPEASSSRSSMTLMSDGGNGSSGSDVTPLGARTPGSDRTKAPSRQSSTPKDVEKAQVQPPTGALDDVAGDRIEKSPRVTDEEREKAPMADLRKVVTPKGELIYVGWDGPDDPNNPRNWSPKRKWLLSCVGFTFCSIVSITVSGYSIAIPQISASLHSSRELAIGGLSLFTLTFGTAPLVLAPLSETYGRKWIYIFSAVVFWLFHIPQALAPNIQTMLVSRFIAGIGGSTAVALVGGTLSDLYASTDRGLPMAIFAFSAFAPTALGPVIFGPLASARGMRDCFWLLFALAGTLTIGLVFTQHETRESVLLSRKAKRLRKETGEHRFVAQADEERESLLTILHVSLTRPIRLFCTEPVLQAFTLWISFSWAVLYLMLFSIPIVMETVYGFNQTETGLSYFAQAIGSFIAMPISFYCDRLYHRDEAKRGPEARMWTGMLGGIIFPVGCWWWAWTSFQSIHWIVPLIGVVAIYCGLLLIYLTVFNYVADSYTLYAASALAAMNVWRNLLGAAFPLFSDRIYDSLGIHGAGSLVGGVATALSVVPFLAFAYGGRLRRKSRFGKELALLQAQQSEK